MPTSWKGMFFRGAKIGGGGQRMWVPTIWGEAIPGREPRARAGGTGGSAAEKEKNKTGKQSNKNLVTVWVPLFMNGPLPVEKKKNQKRPKHYDCHVAVCGPQFVDGPLPPGRKRKSILPPEKKGKALKESPKTKKNRRITQETDRTWSNAPRNNT